MEKAELDEQEAQRRSDLTKVAEIRYGRIPELQKKLDAANARLADLQKDRRLLKEEVDAEDVAEVVSAWTGIPVARMLEGERDKLRHMEDRLRERVVGQDEAIKRRRRTPSAAPAPASATRAGPSARSSSSAPPASARPSSPRPSPSSSSTTRTPWSAST